MHYWQLLKESYLQNIFNETEKKIKIEMIDKIKKIDIFNDYL